MPLTPGRPSIALALLCFVAIGRPADVAGQDFRVYTAVTEIGSDAASRRVVARSLTLFHAGRVYDHMEELGELVIFEPLQDRFILVKDRTATVVAFSELRQMLDVATGAAREYSARLAVSREPEAERLRAQLLFQLQPEFEVRFDPATRRLRLEGVELRYEVRGESVGSPELLERYLAWADWTARLNTVLRSQGTFPGSRETLNRSLREHQLLPVSVTLQSRRAGDHHLRADHEFRWQLQPIDKDQIHQWERLQDSNRVQWVSFREYQQRLLMASHRSAR